MTDADESSKTPTAQPKIERAPDFTTRYANNIYFESTAWDLKITFGHVEQATGQVVISHDFAVTIPWPQAKLALFWLRLHVEGAEAEVGAKIPIRKDLIPPELPEVDATKEEEPTVKLFREAYQRLRKEFIETM